MIVRKDLIIVPIFNRLHNYNGCVSTCYQGTYLRSYKHVCHYTLSRATALAILSEKDGLKALERNLNLTPLQQLLGNNEEALNAQQVLEYVKRNPFPQRQSSIMNKTPTPLQLLIKEMPGETLSHSQMCTFFGDM